MDFIVYFVSLFLKSKGSECSTEHLFSKPTETSVFKFFYMLHKKWVLQFKRKKTLLAKLFRLLVSWYLSSEVNGPNSILEHKVF